jgi:serine/threonine protein kinase
LHPGNVLVTKQSFSAELTDHSAEYKYLLADFGEGKHIAGAGRSITSSNGRLVCAIGKYVAPEVLEGSRGSVEADVYSFGRIGQAIVSLRKCICADHGNNDSETIPTALKEILDQCTSQNCSERPKIRDVVRKLEYLSENIKDHTASWSSLGDKGLEGLAIVAPNVSAGDLSQVLADVFEILRA